MKMNVIPNKPVEKIQKKVKKETVSRPVRNYRTTVIQGYMVIMIITFSVLAFLSRSIPYFPLDLVITRTIQQIRIPWFASLMEFVSFIGFTPQIYFVIGVVAITLYIFGLKWEAFISVLNAFTISVISVTLKGIVHRTRPTVDLVDVFQHLGEYSFPSGHVLIYTAFFGYLFFLSYTLIRKSAIRTAYLVSLASIIILIGPSRIYLGAHWASDVLGAYIFSTTWLLALIYLSRKAKQKFIRS